MASINGVTLKHIEWLNTHKAIRSEVPRIVTAVVYYNGKELGAWSEDVNGGPCNYDFDEKLLERPYLKYISWLRLQGKSVERVGMDDFLFEVLAFTQIQKSEYVMRMKSQGLIPVISIDMKSARMVGGSAYTTLEEAELAYNKAMGYKLPARVVIAVENSKSWDLILGDGEGVKSEKERIKQRNKKKEKVLKESRLRDMDFEDKYTIIESIDTPDVTITDKSTGKSTVVSLYALREVREALYNLYVRK